MSPLSLTTLMVMLNAGAAEGDTAQEIQHLFKFGPDSKFAIQNHTQVLESLNQTGVPESGVELVTGSRVFVNSKNANIRQDYETAVSSLGEVEAFSFANPKQVVEKTNEWVKNRTRGKISKLVEEKDFTDETSVVLLNAVYFRAPWKQPFNKSETAQEDFQVNQSTSVQVDMMHIVSRFAYADLSEAQTSAIFLPYKGDRLSMIIYLPWKSSTLSNLEEKLGSLIPSEVRNSASIRDVSFSLPKFNISSSLDLKDVLTSLGVQKMFKSAEANFTRMSESAGFHVSKIRQKVFIEVNEEGTEAGAATGVIGLAPVDVPTELNVNRPFIFQIFDNVTGTVLFGGRIMNPTERGNPGSEKPGNNGTVNSGNVHVTTANPLTTNPPKTNPSTTSKPTLKVPSGSGPTKNNFMAPLLIFCQVVVGLLKMW